ncbi:NADPH-dependent FMN reductase [Candidatus Saccharibacteria bacterium]|nr:MAG: NADPH-dependent FMN reductase [Candidatus Saccharibacteria bacterium]
MKLAIIVGSIRKQSYNKKLAERIADRLPAGSDVEWVDPNVPLMSEDLEPDQVPVEVRRAAEQVEASDAVLFVSPEYNRSFSGIIKNVIDWLGRESTGRSLRGKPAAIAGATTGPIGTAVMQSQLRPVLAHVGVDVVPSPAVLVTVPDRMNENGELSEQTTAQVDALIAALMQRAINRTKP